MKTEALNNNSSNTMNAAAGDPQTAPTPEQLVEQFRAVAATITQVALLTAAEKKKLRSLADVSPEVVQAQINMIGAADRVAAAVGRPSEEVQQMVDEAGRWTAVETELKAILAGVAGANLIRRQKLALLANQAGIIGGALAKDPEFSGLRVHVSEIRRLKRASRRKKATPEKPAADHNTMQ